MSIERTVSGHYSTGGLLDRIKEGLAAAGIDPENPSPEDLKPVDEFHIGGVEATDAVLDQMAIDKGMSVLDIGSGIGGTARHIATRTGANVTGIDLTAEFVETATALSAMSGLSDRTRFEVGSALDLPFDDRTFDHATLIHVGMNIPDKARLMAEAARVVRPGGLFAIYDIMATGDEAIAFPVPWASSAEGSFLAPLDAYRNAATAAGLRARASRGAARIRDRSLCQAKGRDGRRRRSAAAHAEPGHARDGIRA